MSSEQSAEQPSEGTAEVRAGWRDVELAWAREQLHVETDGPEGVWQSLQRCGFLPDGAQIAAMEILAGTAPLECSPATADYRRLARREALECEIEAFAGRFFEHSPPEREAVWRELRERCGEFPGLMLWLKAWEAGFNVELPANGPTARVVAAIAAVFLARPDKRPALHRRLVIELRGESPSHTIIARDLRANERVIVSLAPGFVEELCAPPPATAELEEFVRLLAGGIEPSPPSDRVDVKCEKECKESPVVRSSLQVLDNSRVYKYLFGGVIVLAMTAPIWVAVLEQHRLHKTYRGQAATPNPHAQTQRALAAIGAQERRIRTFGIALTAEMQQLPGAPIRVYRILGPGPIEHVGESSLRLMGIEPSEYLRPASANTTAVDAEVETTPAGKETSAEQEDGGD